MPKDPLQTNDIAINKISKIEWLFCIKAAFYFPTETPRLEKIKYGKKIFINDVFVSVVAIKDVWYVHVRSIVRANQDLCRYVHSIIVIDSARLKDVFEHNANRSIGNLVFDLITYHFYTHLFFSVSEVVD